MGQHLFEVNMEHLKDHADYKYNKPRKINTKYSVIGKTLDETAYETKVLENSVTIRSWIGRAITVGNLHRLYIHHTDEKKTIF